MSTSSDTHGPKHQPASTTADPALGPIGVIGLGPTGRAIIARLRAAGHTVYVWSRNPQPEPNFLGSCAELAEICDTLQILVGDEPGLQTVRERLAPALASRHTTILSCTVSPEATWEFARVADARGAALLEAPFDGGRTEAARGALVYHVAGDRAVLERVRPALAPCARAVLYLGETRGTAMAVRMALAIVEAAATQSLAEAMTLLHRHNVPLHNLGDVLRTAHAGSALLLEKFAAISRLAFEPGRPVRALLHDVDGALQLAASAGIDLPAARAALDTLRAAARNGWHDQDHAAVARHYFDAPPLPTPAAQSAADPGPIPDPTHETPDASDPADPPHDPRDQPARRTRSWFRRGD